MAVSEGAMCKDDAKIYHELLKAKENAHKRSEKDEANARLLEFQTGQSGKILQLAQKLEQLTGLESRVTILGYMQRGGTPSAMERLLATQLGSAAADLITKNASGIMIAIKNRETEPVPLEEVVDKRRMVQQDHIWVKTARRGGPASGIKIPGAPSWR